MMWCSASLFAQNERDSLRYELPEFTIIEKKPLDIIITKTLSGEKLERLSTYSVADAIRYFSGVQIKDYGGLGGLKTIDVRSMGTNHMGVFYDGIQLGNAQNGQIDLGKFSMDNIESISLCNGQRSNIFQSAKEFMSAGTIYLQTKKPQFKRGKSYNVTGRLKAGSFGTIIPSFIYEQNLPHDYALNVSGEFTSSDGQYPFRYKRVFNDYSVAYDTTAIRKNGDIKALRLESTLYKKFDGGSADLHGYFHKSHRGLPGPIVKNVFEHGQRLHDENWFVQGKLTNQFGDFYSLKVNAKYAYDWTRYIDNEPTNPLHIDNQYLQHDLYLSIANLFEFYSWLKASAAFDYQMNSMEANLINFSFPTRHTLLGSIAVEASVGNRLTLQASMVGTSVKELVKKNLPAPANQLMTPSFFFSSRPCADTDLYFYGFYKRAFRLPTFNDLYYTFIGNATLNPEYTTQYNLGTSYNYLADKELIRSIDLRADVYYNEVKDKIVAVPAGNMFRWMMLNLGRVKILGTEISVGTSLRLTKEWHASLSAGYTYQKALDITDKASKTYKHQIVYIPRHSGSLLGSMDYKSWGANLSFIYTGVRYNAKYNDRHSRMLPWYTTDLSIRKSFTLGRMPYPVNCSLDINNILNQHYDVVLNYPMPGRNYKLNITVKI